MRNSLILIFILFSFPSISEGKQKDDIDEIIYKSTILIVEKQFVKAFSILENLLSNQKEMTLSQRSETLYSLLELSYIIDSPTKAKKYGESLLELIKNKPNYIKLKSRLIERICTEKDWAKFKPQFSKTCGGNAV